MQTIWKMFPHAHLGQKGVTATQEMFYCLKHFDLMGGTKTQQTAPDCSLIFVEMKNKQNVHKYSKPAHSFPVNSVYLSPPKFETSSFAFFGSEAFADGLT